MNERINRPNTKSTRRQQNRRPIRCEPMLRAHFLLVFLHCKHRIDRNPTHEDLLRGYAEHFEINPRFVERNEVALVVMDQPHRMHVEVSDYDHLSTRQTLLSLQPRNNLSRQKVSTDDQIRLVLAQEFHKRTRVELIERKTPSFILPGFV